jgi:hypothetical protein
MYEFAYALKFRELEATEQQTLLIDTNTLVFPADFRMLHDMGIEAVGTERFEGKLIRETRAKYIQLSRAAGSFVRTAAPRWYHVYGTNFVVRPTADANYDFLVHYWKRLDILVDDDDTSIFPDDWDDVILAGALYRGFRHFNEFDRYLNLKNDYLGLVRSRKMEEDLEEFPEGGVMPVTWRDQEDQSFYGTPNEETSDRPFGGYD